MADSNLVSKLVTLTARQDLQPDVREVLNSTITEIKSPLSTDVFIYRAVVLVLGIALLTTVFGGIALAFVGNGDPTIKLPDAIIAIGSASVGALAGLLAPSPIRSNQSST